MSTPKAIEKPIPPDERNGMRVYLQRAEVRLSTMHRVAGIFLNGAGLLILFPLLFRDVVRDMMVILVTNTSSILVSLPLVVPFVISLALPLYSLYLLLKDLVEFYFAGNFPGYSTRTPRFVIPASVLPPDEASSPKKKVLEIQYSDDDYGSGLRKFALPFDDEDEKEKKYYDDVVKDGIIPETRKDLPNLNASSSKETKREKEHFNAIFGLSGAYDRNLVDEVAFTEVMLARHASSLRILVLRYAKALLVVIWTILVSFSTVAIVHAVGKPSGVDDPYSMMVVAGLYCFWAVGTYFVVRLPIRWIREMTRSPEVKVEGAGPIGKDKERDIKKELKELIGVRDAQIQNFETKVKLACWIAGVPAAVSFGVQLVLLVFRQ